MGKLYVFNLPKTIGVNEISINNIPMFVATFSDSLAHAIEKINHRYNPDSIVPIFIILNVNKEDIVDFKDLII